MKTQNISVDEFKAATSGVGFRAPYGANKALLRDAVREPVRLSFESEAKAVSKLAGLYIVRRERNAQVRFLRCGNTLFIGPGKYVRFIRGN